MNTISGITVAGYGHQIMPCFGDARGTWNRKAET